MGEMKAHILHEDELSLEPFPPWWGLVLKTLALCGGNPSAASEFPLERLVIYFCCWQLVLVIWLSCDITVMDIGKTIDE